ncbi:MAG: putative sugar-binding N-terminal domain-containing protein [Candidatus Nitrotoga sp. LAW]|nr:MAG: putative sugar-binding N-terminal domain-containing protein [Candidatus Nitrotoga sp. LAW]
MSRKKTAGRIKANQVERFLLAEIRGDVSACLMALHNNVCCVVDAETQADLNYFAAQLKTATASGKHSLFRSAASLLAALAQLPPQPVAASAMRQYVRNGKPGAVIVGSYVKKTTAQLNKLLKEPDIIAIEVDVYLIATERSALLQEVLHQAALAHVASATSVIYTSRAERGFADKAARLAFGEQVSAFLMDVVRGLPNHTGLSHQQRRHHFKRRAVRWACAQGFVGTWADSAGLLSGALSVRPPALCRDAGGDFSRQCR